MLIVNADDWGRSRRETDAALACFLQGRVTSVSAMVFMPDSERGAALAREHKLDVGLHVNFTERFLTAACLRTLDKDHGRIVQFLKSSKYAQLLFNPFLMQAFRDLYQCQWDEFLRLYGTMPSHVDGHQHMHLCANMLIGRIIPKGETIRRHFSFWPGEKGVLNRTYRRAVDGWLTRRYYLVDLFLALSQNLGTDRFRRVVRLAKEVDVELMTHPAEAAEYAFLMGCDYSEALCDVTTIDHRALSRRTFDPKPLHQSQRPDM